MRRLARLRADRSGAAALEFALLGLPFVVLMLGLLEFGRGLHIRNALDAAADRAQRALLIDPSATPMVLEEVVRDSFMAGPSERLTVAFAGEMVDGQDYMRVSLGYEMRLLLPAPLGRSLTIGSSRRVTLRQ